MKNDKCACRRGRPKAMPDAERRSLIVAEAEKLFIEKGYSGTSTDSLAARCRMSKRTLYRLFPGKSELFAAVVDSESLRLIDIADNDYADIPLEEALARIFMVDLDQETYEYRASLLRVLEVECATNAELRDILHRDAAQKDLVELKAWIDRQRSARRLRVDNTSSLAHMLLDTFVGAVAFDAIGGFGWDSPAERISHFRQCIKVILHGLVPGDEK